MGTFDYITSYRCIFGAESSPGELVCANHVLYLGATYEAPLKFLYKELCILLLSHLLCLLQYFEEKSLVWAVIRILQVSGSGSQPSSNEDLWVWVSDSACVGLVMFVILGSPHAPHAFQLRTTSLYVSHAKNVLGFFHLTDSSNPYVL